MVNLYLCKKSVMWVEGLVRCGFQPIDQKDESNRHGSINQFLLSTLR